MTVLFYAIDPAGTVQRDGALPLDVCVHWWRPAIDGLPLGSMRGRNLCWWGLDRLGLLTDHRFAELSLRRGGARSTGWC